MTSPNPEPLAVADAPGFWDLDLLGVAQGAFWIVAGTVAILTYLQAKKSLFQPLRVEVFKQQLALFEQVTETFSSKSETHLRRQFDLPRILELNALTMFDAYCSIGLGVALPKDQRTEARFSDEIDGGLLILRDGEVEWEVIGPPSEDKPAPASRNQPKWEDYRLNFVLVTPKAGEARNEIERYIRNPLTPPRLVELLRNLDRAVGESLVAVKDAVDEAAPVMRASYPTVDRLNGAKPAWVANMWNDKLPKLEPLSDEIAAFIREYVQSGRLGFVRD